MTTQSEDSRRAYRAHGPEVGCAGKVPFESRRLAQAVVQRHADDNRNCRQAYRCPFCKKWHVGTNFQRKKRRAAAARRRAASDE